MKVAIQKRKEVDGSFGSVIKQELQIEETPKRTSDIPCQKTAFPISPKAPSVEMKKRNKRENSQLP
jgi:hypothetical protein